MKKSLFLYLFVIAIVFNVFTYMYYSKQLDFEKTQSETYHKKTKDTLLVLENRLDDADYFSLEKNQNALDYFYDSASGNSVDILKSMPLIKDKLKDFNNQPNGNPYTGFEPMNGKNFMINKVRFLNHRWIIADFTNGEMWGEAIIKYFLNADGSVSFENAESVIYAKQ